jgi:uncharacterized membrane protein YgdD (TMEM256/DUF423 family)
MPRLADTMLPLTRLRITGFARMPYHRDPMTNFSRLMLTLAGVNAVLAIALGAFGAHALRARLEPRLLEVFHTAVLYHLFHTLGLAVVALTALKLVNSRALAWSGWLMMVGIVLFCGSLYLLSVTGARSLGAITPLGGVAFILAWIAFAIAAMTAR